jgi:demethylmenaquinone methyltransferase/2-methoxy-6-polyprenyl-1,4-benzoquinol methylase
MYMSTRRRNRHDVDVMRADLLVLRLMTAPGTHTSRPPHPPLPAYYGGESARPAWVRATFNRTAEDYDRVEAVMSAGSGGLYRRQALVRSGLVAGMNVLDVGTGTGLVAKQAARIVGEQGSVTGVDPGFNMLRAGALPESIRAVTGMAERLPLVSRQFDFLSMGYALRHVSDLAVTFAEFHRVLKPGGRLCILEITPPQGRAAAAVLRLYMRKVVPILTRVVARHAETATLMRYYWDTIESCVPPNELIDALQAAGFHNVERHVELRIFSEYRAVRPG